MAKGHGTQAGGGAPPSRLIAEKNESARTTVNKTFLNIGFFSLLTKVTMPKDIRWTLAAVAPDKSFPNPEQRLTIDNQKRPMMYNQPRTASPMVPRCRNSRANNPTFAGSQGTPEVNLL